MVDMNDKKKFEDFSLYDMVEKYKKDIPGFEDFVSAILSSAACGIDCVAKMAVEKKDPNSILLANHIDDPKRAVRMLPVLMSDLEKGVAAFNEAFNDANIANAKMSANPQKMAEALKASLKMIAGQTEGGKITPDVMLSSLVSRAVPEIPSDLYFRLGTLCLALAFIVNYHGEMFEKAKVVITQQGAVADG